MPSAWGGNVYHSRYNQWQGGVNAYVESYSATQATVVVQAKFKTSYGIYSAQFYGYTSCGSQSGENQYTVDTRPSGYHELTLRTQRFTVNRPTGNSNTTVSCTGRVRNSGTYTPGSSQATVNVTINHIDHQAPAAPSSCSTTRSSDTQARVTWTNGSSSTSAPRSNVLIERQTDGGSWVQLASLGADVVNYTDNGISSNHSYAYRVRSQGLGGTSGYSTSGTIYTSPATPNSVTVAKVSGATVSVSADVSNVRTALAYEVQRLVGSGSWQKVADTATFPVSDSVTGTVRYRVRAYRGSLSSGWRESNTVTTIVPPNAPTITQYPFGAAVVGDYQSVTWVPNHPDGSAQSQAQVEYSIDGGDPVTVDISGTSTTWEVPEDVTGERCTIRVRVRTKGIDPSWGAWSSYVQWNIDYPPSVVITYPENDTEVVSLVPFNIEWDVTDASGVSYQQIVLRDQSGSILHQAEPSPDARSYTFSEATYLPKNFGSYTVAVTARGGSSLTYTALRTFATDYAGPAMPWAHVSYTEDLVAEVEIRHGSPSWELVGTTLVSPEDNATEDSIPITAGTEQGEDPKVIEIGDVLATKSVSVTRVLPDGSQWLVADNMASGQTARDPLPPLNVDYSYLVTSVSQYGTAATNEVPARLDSDFEAFNFGPGAGTCLKLGFDATGSETTTHSGETFRFAMGPDTAQLPTFYPDGDIDVTGSHTYVTYDRDLVAMIRRVIRDRANSLCWFRDAFGNRARVLASWTTGYDAKSYELFNVSADLTEVVWEDPSNG